MADTCHMHADLVCTSSLKPALDIGELSKALQHLIMRDCFSCAFRHSAHLLALSWMTTERGIDTSGIFLEIPVDYCLVNPVNGMFF